METRNLIRAATLAALAGLSGAASAALVTVSGATVEFEYDDALIGSASVLGDTLQLGIDALGAFQGTVGTDTASHTFTINVTAKPGYYLSLATLTENGSYQRIEDDPGSTAVDVDGDFIVDGVSNPFGADDLSATTDLIEFEISSWFANNVDPEAIGPTSASILVANDLSATLFGSGGVSAQIDLLQLNLAIQTSPVPLPAPLLLLGPALAGLLGAQRLRRK